MHSREQSQEEQEDYKKSSESDSYVTAREEQIEDGGLKLL
jgi:hypothetical protein